jgi:hypothetical protein
VKRKIKPRLNEVDARNVQSKVDWEGGMDYTFRFQTHFPEIKDKKFRKLYKAYIKAAQDLADYCGLDEEPEWEGDDCDSCPGCGDDLNVNDVCETCEGKDEDQNPSS